jgi:hypothetical protein
MWTEFMMRRLFLIMLLAPLCFGFARAQESVDAPLVHVGDWWKYRTVDGFTNEPSAEFTHRIVELNDREITVQLQVKNVKTTELRYFNRDWNPLDVGKAKFEPYYPGQKFPTKVGDKWRQEYRAISTNGQTNTAFLIGTVVAYEKVTVPAGIFDAYKIETHIDAHSTDESATSSRSVKTIWYAPAVKKYVRSEAVISSDGRVRNKTVDELIEYSLKDDKKSQDK